MENKRGVKKGAWTCEEDKLLKACINKYGEGKWHLVPHRAGLNRCRKSCRLRWLNYLSPDINRESFAEDEVDMMLRLHKLLGNRWTLIAGRLPGRTANDVKNYWHTHLRNKVISKKKKEKKEKEKPKETMKAHEVIKPQPLTLSSHSRWLKGKNNIMEKPIATVSTKVVTSAKDRDDEETMVTNQIGRDCVDAMWWDSLFNLGTKNVLTKMDHALYYKKKTWGARM